MVSLHLCALIRACLESVGTDSRYVSHFANNEIKVGSEVLETLWCGDDEAVKLMMLCSQMSCGLMSSV